MLFKHSIMCFQSCFLLSTFGDVQTEGADMLVPFISPEGVCNEPSGVLPVIIAFWSSCSWVSLLGQPMDIHEHNGVDLSRVVHESYWDFYSNSQIYTV